MAEVSSQTLHIVARELASELNEARASLEAFGEQQDNLALLRKCNEHLHSVHGALRVAEVYGAALLAEEMGQVADYLIANFAEKRHLAEGLDALMRAMVQLPTYLERVMSGGRDMALVLLPLLNDLRAVRGHALLSEGTLLLLNLSSDQQANPTAGAGEGALTVAQWARKLRTRFQLGLLGWIKGERIDQNLEILARTAEKLEHVATTQAVFQLWWVVGSVLEALREGGLEGSASIKRLLGQADREMKRLYELGEARYADSPPLELLNNLLYYVARARTNGPRVAAVRASFRLSELLPVDDGIEQARESLSAPSVKLMKTVAAAIKEDLSRVKDALDIFVRQGGTQVDELAPQLDLLKKIADTLGVLGLGELRDKVQTETADLQRIVAQKSKATEGTLLRMAATLIKVEDSLDEQLVGMIVPTQSESGAAPAKPPGPDDIEFRLVTEAVLRECIVNMARIKEAIAHSVEKPREAQAIDQIPQLMRGITAGLLMLGKTRVVEIMEGIDKALAQFVRSDGMTLPQEAVDRLADAIVAVEYYMETIQAGRADPWYMLDNAETCLRFLAEAQPIPRVDAYGGAGPDHARTVVIEANASTVQLGTEHEPTAVLDPVTKEVRRPTKPVAPPPAAEPPPMPPALTKPVDREVDPEFVELFIEEAKDEIAKLNQFFPLWDANPQDQEALINVRRSFHTLKGSGRMVGAQLIGDFAWSVENMLNRVINKTLDRTPDMMALMRSAVAAVPELVEQLETGRAPTAEIAKIINTANGLAGVRSGSSTPAPQVSTPAVRRAPEAPVLSTAAAKSPAAAAPAPEKKTAPAVAPPRASSEPPMDPGLHEIYAKETAGHLAAIRRFIAACALANAPYPVTEDLHRSCHTLSGTAKTAGARQGIKIAEPLNRYIRKLYDSSIGLSDAGLTALKDSVTAIQQVVDNINESTGFFLDHGRIVNRLVELEHGLDVELSRLAERLSSSSITAGELTGEYALPAGNTSVHEQLRAELKPEPVVLHAAKVEVPVLHVEEPSVTVTAQAQLAGAPEPATIELSPVEPSMLATGMFVAEAHTLEATIDISDAVAAASREAASAQSHAEAVEITLDPAAPPEEIPHAVVAPPAQAAVDVAAAPKEISIASADEALALAAAPEISLDTAALEELSRGTADLAKLDLDSSLAPEAGTLDTSASATPSIEAAAPEEITLDSAAAPEEITLSSTDSGSAVDSAAPIEITIDPAAVPEEITLDSSAAEEITLDSDATPEEITLGSTGANEEIALDSAAATEAVTLDATAETQQIELNPALIAEEITLDSASEPEEITLDSAFTQEVAALMLDDFNVGEEVTLDSSSAAGETKSGHVKSEEAVVELEATDASMLQTLSWSYENFPLDRDAPASAAVTNELAASTEVAEEIELTSSDDVTQESVVLEVADELGSDLPDAASIVAGELTDIDATSRALLQMNEPLPSEASDIVIETAAWAAEFEPPVLPVETSHAVNRDEAETTRVPFLRPADIAAHLDATRQIEVAPTLFDDAVVSSASDAAQLEPEFAADSAALEAVSEMADVEMEAHSAEAAPVTIEIEPFAVASTPSTVTAAPEVAPSATPVSTSAIEPAPLAAQAAPVTAAEPVEEEEEYDDGDFDADVAAIFTEEATELLDTADHSLSSWMRDRANSALVFELKRAVHTLKGGARMAGIRSMGDLSHELETLMGLVETGQVPAQENVFAALQASLDELHRMRDIVAGGDRAKPARQLMRRIRALAAGEPEPVAAPAVVPPPVAAPIAPEIVAPAAIAPVFEAAPEEVVEIESYSPDDQHIGSETDIVPTLTDAEALSALETDIEAVNDLEAEFGADELGAVAPRESVRVEETPAAARNAANAATGIHAALDVSTLPPELPPDAEQEETTAAAEPQAPALPGRERPTQQEPREFARVDADLLDNLLNNAGEVSIFRSRMEQQVSSIEFNLAELGRTVTRLKEQLRKLELETEAQILHRRHEEHPDRADFDPLELDRYSTIQQLTRAFAESVSDVSSIEGLLENLTREAQNLLLQQSRVVTEMQNGLMRTRMVPFQRHVQRLSRLVRQVANDTDKRVELVVVGASGELDRQVLERMLPPFEHMLRNSVVHGIETPEERVARGKSAQGTIKVGLHREGSEMVIVLEDDGRGIDVNAVRERARARGLLAPGRVLSDEEAMQLILEPGFSTASNITQHAGRGVGMDVVVNEIKKLGGALFTQSQPGQGVKFTIRLPFTLAITQALIVRTGDELYALPLPSVEGVARISKSEVVKHLAEEVPTFNYGGQIYRLQHLGAFVGGGPSQLPELDVSVPLILIRAGEHSTAVVTDELVGSREMVVKSVGPQIATIRGIAGATILGDGRIVIILDMHSLVRAEWRSKGALETQGPKEDRRTFALVVDDSITVRRVTQRLLERNGMRVMTAKDGIDALSILQEHIPDVILLDIEMPRMDGYELATQVRADARLTDIPIVMITSRTGEKHRARAIEIGVNDYLGKPYQENQLLDAIEPLVQARRRKVS